MKFCTICFNTKIKDNKCLECGFNSISETKSNEDIERIRVCRKIHSKIKRMEK